MYYEFAFCDVLKIVKNLCLIKDAPKSFIMLLSILQPYEKKNRENQEN